MSTKLLRSVEVRYLLVLKLEVIVLPIDVEFKSEERFCNEKLLSISNFFKIYIHHIDDCMLKYSMFFITKQYVDTA